MRCFANVTGKTLIILLTSAYTLLTACKGNYEPFTQPDPVSVNQEFMLGQVLRFEPALAMGEFVATFQDPLGADIAGWADCKPGGRAPWYVHFNEDFVETLRLDGPAANGQMGRDYMSALVAHEMCHHWVTMHQGSCYDEMAAETCAFNLVSKGRPE